MARRNGQRFRRLDDILTVVRLKLPKELRRSLAGTNIVENMMGTFRRVTRNAKRWRDAGMARHPISGLVSRRTLHVGNWPLLITFYHVARDPVCCCYCGYVVNASELSTGFAANAAEGRTAEFGCLGRC